MTWKRSITKPMRTVSRLWCSSARAVHDPFDVDRGATVMPCSPLALAMERSHGKLLGQEELGNSWDRRTSTLIFHIGQT